MIIDKPGKITDRIHFLGRKESCVYILKGKEEYAMLGGGMIHTVSDIIKQIKDLNIEEAKIKRIVILHSHFDHCGAVPFLKKQWPWVKVTASAKAKELLSSPKVLKTIDHLNRLILKRNKYENKAKNLLSPFEIEIEDIVHGGDILSCDDLTMEVIDAPGHSSCSIAIYVPEEKAMFASDAGGIPFGDQIFTAANSDFDKYQNSLKKMSKYDINIFLAEHFGAMTGKDAQTFLQRSIDSAIKTEKILKVSYARTNNVKESAEEVTDMFMEKAPKDFHPKEIMFMVVEQMMQNIARKISS